MMRRIHAVWLAIVCSLSLLKTCSCGANCLESGLITVQDCSGVQTDVERTSGVFQVCIPDNSIGSRLVYCTFTQSPPIENYLVILRRQDGSENFERPWKDYAEGFGNLNGEFWLGNDVLYVLTNSYDYKLRIDFRDFDGQYRYAEYSSFRIASAADNYRLNVSGYSGDAGDSLSYHSGSQFSTIDADHDPYTLGFSCAQTCHGAWWYASNKSPCLQSNLNGRYLRGNHTSYADGVEWAAFTGYYYSLMYAQMRIARV